MDSGKVAHRRKLGSPVIGLRAPQKSQHLQGVSAKSLDLSKVIRLLEDPLTLLKELMGIAKILNICAQKATDHPEYVPVLCEALTICRLPFLKEKASDELTYAQDVTEFLSQMGCLMRVSDAEVRRHVVECVKSFYGSVAPKQMLDGTDGTKRKPRTFPSNNRFSRLSLSLQPTSPGYRLQLLERSELAQTLLLSMATLENQPTIKLQLLQTLQILSSASDMNCSSILLARGAETVCLHMNEPDPTGQVLFRSSEILWNLLERGDEEEVAAQLGSLECVLSLKEAFSHLLLSGCGHSDLQLRNDLLVITTLVAESPDSQLIESFFAKQLVAFSTFPELKIHNPLVHNLKLSYSKEDLKMKKLLLNLLVIMSRDLAALQLYREERVMLALLTLMKPPDASSPELQSGSRPWSAAQSEELQLQALATLATVAPLMLDEYMSCEGNTCLLLLLDWCSGQDSYFGHGHSVHAAGGRGSKKAQMRHCIRVLRSMTSLGEETINQDLCDQGTINQLLGILMQMEAGPDDDDDVIAVEIKSDIQVILSTLCETDMHRKELFGSEGVEMAVHFLRKGSDKFYSGLGHNKLLLSTVDCVWSCIVGCYTTEDYFLVKDGVFHLLDLLSTSPRCVHGIVLATLLELCDNPNTVSHILTWRNGNGQTAPRLLLQLWREEEEELGVHRNKHGGITDPQRPVLTHFQPDDPQPSFPANLPSAAVLEMSENLRSKIYSIFCKLGFQELPGLLAKDYVTLTIIRRYLDLKVGEVWAEISRELSVDGVRPVSPDREALSNICKTAEDTARRLMEEQNSILGHHQEEDVSEEELTYTEMKSRWKQKEFIAKSWEDYVSRTSNYETLKEVKAQREKDAESSRAKPKDEGAALHPAEHFIGHVIAVESTGAQGPAGVKVTLVRAPVRATGQDRGPPTRPNPDAASTGSSRD
ncbi:cilia- and flagella-associated protein 69-like isoform X2 [Archocentrus centrarchus]|uniref:cilia- and flagella-associated protein 69-like isoform X2 n=1 Tax=Archocentrus centrarchus TaxID=63155 RepID=UPI0011E9CB4F|nr:cilia- and flagella-associated protein 69-like isoform X2 [Archocentrus centrarchus]